MYLPSSTLALHAAVCDSNVIIKLVMRKKKKVVRIIANCEFVTFRCTYISDCGRYSTNFKPLARKRNTSLQTKAKDK
jgi:hypothetical protein